jgi:catechol 2,3-dioxygenase
MEQQTSSSTTQTSIHPDTHIGRVTLRVSNLERSLKFYEGILGFKHIDHTSTTAVLSAQDNIPLLELHELAGTPPQPQWSAGLYHVAILLPSRADLGQVLLRLANAGMQVGQGDHLVSEALYISDPDHNGLELYQDRPRSTWQWSNGSVKMATDPVDIKSLMDDGQRAEKWDVLPAGTRIGHIHLQVAAIPQAKHFYHTILGFDITAQMPSALFISAGGYHHHIGMNTWQSRGAGPAPKNAAGLHIFVISLPNREALADVEARLAAYNVPIEEQGDNFVIVADPWDNRIKLMVSSDNHK